MTTATIDAQGQAAIQKVLEGVTAGPNSIPGLVFGAATKDKIVFTGGAGKRSLDGDTTMDDDTVVWIASCTKVITAMACMQLVEQGKCKLDDPVDSILPEVARAQILDPETMQLTPAKTKITLRMLLTHTAGYSYSFFNEGIQKWCTKQGGDEFTGDPRYFDQPLVAEPNTKWRYGVNIDWAGILVERVSGLKLGEYFDKHIFHPSGIDDIGFEVTDKMKSRLAGMHQRDPDGSLTVRKHFPIAYSTTNKFHSGGGGLFANIKSYLKVLQILLNEGQATNGARILKAETVKEMFQDHVPSHLTAELDVPIPSADTSLANPLENMQPGTEGHKGWGLSFLKINIPLPTGRAAGSVWWAGLANNFYWIDYENGVCGMVQSQILPFGDLNVLGAWGAIEAEVYKGLGIAPAAA